MPTSTEGASDPLQRVLALTAAGRQELREPRSGLSLPQRWLLGRLDGQSSLAELTAMAGCPPAQRLPRDAARLAQLGLAADDGQDWPEASAFAPSTVHGELSPDVPPQMSPAAPTAAAGRRSPGEGAASRMTRRGPMVGVAVVMALVLVVMVFRGTGPTASAGGADPSPVDTTLAAASVSVPPVDRAASLPLVRPTAVDDGPPAAAPSLPAAVATPADPAARRTSVEVPTPAAPTQRAAAEPSGGVAADLPVAPRATAAARVPADSTVTARPPTQPDAPVPRTAAPGATPGAAAVTVAGGPLLPVPVPAEPVASATVQTPTAAAPSPAPPPEPPRVAVANVAPSVVPPPAGLPSVAPPTGSLTPGMAPAPVGPVPTANPPVRSLGEAASGSGATAATVLRPLSRVEPSFPREGIGLGSRAVLLRARLTVAADGSVSQVVFVRSEVGSRPFERAARSALLQWRFPPGSGERSFVQELRFSEEP